MIKKIFFTILFIILLPFIYSKFFKNTNNKIIRIKVSLIMPIVVENEYKLDTTSIYVSYYNKYCTFELPYHSSLQIDSLSIYDSLKYSYFIFDTTKNNGSYFKNFKDITSKKVSCDSIFKTAFNGGKTDKPELTKLLIDSIKLVDKKEYTSIYCKYDNNNLLDSTYFYFDSRLKNIPFSLNIPFDFYYNSKLFKIIGFLKNTNNSAINNIKDVIELKISDDFNYNELEIFFKKFINSNK